MQIFNNRHFEFSSNGSVQTAIDTIITGFSVQGATAVLEGMDIQFANRNDHHLGRLNVNLATEVTGGTNNLVHVTATFALRDWSGGNNDLDGDDPIQGTIRYSVIVV